MAGRGAGTLRLLCRLSGGYGAALLLLGALGAAPLGAEARASGLAGVSFGAVLLALAGLLATLAVAWARLCVGRPLSPPAPERRGWVRLLPRRRRVRPDAARRLARMARRPQGIIVPVPGLSAACAVWRFWPGAPGPLPHAALVGGGAAALSFPLLVMQRVAAAVPRARLPEAPALEALLFVPVAAIPLAALLHVLAGSGMAWARPAMAVVGLCLCVVAAELAVRALANWLLPPPPPAPHCAGRGRGADPHPPWPRFLAKLGAPLRAGGSAADGGGPDPGRMGLVRRRAARL